MATDPRVALVTAAAGAGIGAAVARRLAQDGLDVVVTDAHERRCREFAGALTDEVGREVSGYHLDVTDHDQVCAVISEVAAVKGRLDVLVNNAGWSKIEPVAEMSLDTVGFKPTYGTIDDAGGFQAFSPFISAGPLARCVADARCLHSVLSADGAGTGDSPVGLGPRRVAWCSKPEGRPIDADVGDVVATAVTQLAACGHDVSPVELDLGGWEEIFGPLVPAEEGERRGHLLRGPYQLTRYHGRSLMAAEQLDPGVLTAARSALAQFRERVDRYFCDYDVIVTPATATTAFELGCRPTAIAGEPVARLWGPSRSRCPSTFPDIPRWCCPPGSLTACQSRSSWWDDTGPTPSCCRSPGNWKPDWMCVPSPAWRPACESRERRHP